MFLRYDVSLPKDKIDRIIRVGRRFICVHMLGRSIYYPCNMSVCAYSCKRTLDFGQMDVVPHHCYKSFENMLHLVQLTSVS